MSLIYCVEDDDGIRELISCALKSGGYSVKAFPAAKPLYDALKISVPSLILLDIMLPDEDGLTVLARLKSDPPLSDIPVIMLSRIKAVLRRSAKQSGERPETLEIGGCCLDASRRIVTYNGKEVMLTYKEFELLMYLMRHQSIAVSRDKLMEMVWGYEFAGETRTVDMHIKTLRRKLEEAGCTDLIRTVRGVGYKCN